MSGFWSGFFYQRVYEVYEEECEVVGECCDKET